MIGIVQFSSTRGTRETLNCSHRIQVSCGKSQKSSKPLWVTTCAILHSFELYFDVDAIWILLILVAVFAEHRYYGQSLPFGNKSFTDPEFSGYLSSQQALADYADLLSTQLNTKQRPVVAFGGSYGGMLAAWFRMKYPHLVTGAIASSAPILQFTADCNRFNTILTSVFSAGHKICAQNIKASWNVIKWVSL